MSNVEYQPINRLGKERRVVLSNDLFVESYRAIIHFDQFRTSSQIKAKKYPTADYDTILNKFESSYRELPKGPSIASIELSQDEQRYISYMMIKGARNMVVDPNGGREKSERAFSNQEQFEYRCEIANRELSLPPGVLRVDQIKYLKQDKQI